MVSATTTSGMGQVNAPTAGQSTTFATAKYMILGLGLNQILIKTKQGFRELKLDHEEHNY